MDVAVGLKRKLSAEEMITWTVVLKKTLESPLDSKEIQPVHPKGNQSWIFIGRTDAEAETPILWPSDAKKTPFPRSHWCWGRLKAGGEGEHRGWDGWMASLTQWTWVWVNSGLACCSPWGSQRVGHDWATELNWTILQIYFIFKFILKRNKNKSSIAGDSLCHSSIIPTLLRN